MALRINDNGIDRNMTAGEEALHLASLQVAQAEAQARAEALEAKQVARQAILDRLGLTEQEAQLLLGSQMAARTRDTGYISAYPVIVSYSTDPLSVDYLVLAGGGGGGEGWTGGSAATAGGGAGGLRSTVTNTGGLGTLESALSLTPSTSYTVTIGAGGAIGLPGANSVFATVTSTGGGSGAYSNARGSYNGGDGGSSGGGSGSSGVVGTRTASPVQGFNGASATSQTVSGGGGGAGGAASGATRGAGLASSITGSSVTYALGGEAGGGGGTKATGAANSGTGGGGNFGTGGAAQNGYSGGSGVVILRYPNTWTITIGAGLTGTTTTSGANTIATITAGTGNVSWT